jgi:hypothetical protein
MKRLMKRLIKRWLGLYEIAARMEGVASATHRTHHETLHLTSEMTALSDRVTDLESVVNAAPKPPVVPALTPLAFEGQYGRIPLFMQEFFAQHFPCGVMIIPKHPSSPSG